MERTERAERTDRAERAERADGPPRGPGVQVVARVAEILRALQDTPGGLTQSQLADQLGFALTTTHRLLGALEQEGLVSTSGARGRYQLGPAITQMALAASRDLVLRVHPVLESLSRQIGETVDLAMLEGSRVQFVDQVTGTHPLRAVSEIGGTFPLYSCAPGKAILAELPMLEVNRRLPARFEALTPNTITSAKALKDELAQIAARGYAVDRDEQTEGISAVGVAFTSPHGSWMAMSVPMPTQRFDGVEAELGELLMRARDRLVGDLQSVASDPA